MEKAQLAHQEVICIFMRYAYPKNKPFMITYSLRKGFEITNSGPNENPGVVHC